MLLETVLSLEIQWSHMQAERKTNRMKPIAVVHWQGRDGENSRSFYDRIELERFTRGLKERDFVFWTCMCELNAVDIAEKSRSMLVAFYRT